MTPQEPTAPTLPLKPGHYVLKDGAGIEWSVDPETGRGIRITPLPGRSGTSRRSETVRYFEPTKRPDWPVAPQSCDALFGFLIAKRPHSASVAMDYLVKEFPGTPLYVRDAAVLKYCAAFDV